MRVEERIAPYAVQANALVPLGEVCKTTSGGTPSRKNPDYFNGPIPWVKSGELPDGPVVEIEEAISEEALRQSSAKLFPAGTLLMALYGATVGKLGILTRPAATNQAVCAIFPPPDLDTKFLFWFLRFKRSELIAQAVGGAQPNISQGIVRDLKIPLVPLQQQKRIVAEIEKQFSRLDEAVTNLKRVKANLKRYKAAVLKAAVEGRLVETEAERTRREGRSYETGAQLLQRILETRRSQWQGKGKYKEPVAPDTADLPELPEGWAWVTWEMILAPEDGAFRRGPFGSTLKKSIFVESGHKVYEQYNAINDDPSFGRYYITDDKFTSMDAFAVRAGDFLVSCSGTIGRITQIPDRFESGVINQALLRVRTNNALISDSYFLMHFRSPYFQQQILDNAQGAAMTNVKGVADLKAIPIPLPPIPDQGRIVSDVERRLSLLHETEAQVAANLRRAKRLSESILAASFLKKLETKGPNNG